MKKKLYFVWDYDLDEAQFQQILDGKLQKGRLDQDWAAQRLLEYGTYSDIIQMVGYSKLIRNWPRWRPLVRSEGRRRGFDFLATWLPERHPEVLID